MNDAEVLVVGAGPTGLVLALYLVRSGVRVRIVEKNDGPGLASRAMAVQARTLEFYDQINFADDVIRRGIKVERLHLYEEKDEVAVFNFADFGKGISPFPFILSFPQDEHEKLLTEQLGKSGINVEWQTELADFTDDGGKVSAVLHTPQGAENISVDYLCGCDGAHSRVREILDMDFPGGTYEQVFYVADVQASGKRAVGDLTVCLESNIFSLIFPIRTTGMYRLIGIMPEEIRDPESASFEDIRPYVENLTELRVDKLNWFSIYRVHHRVADHFRKGRAFIAGDAGHIHSPAGGQGMNTGIGDAVNLSWKLAAVLKHRADPSILDSYEIERLAFARLLVETTDRAFKLIVNRGTGGQMLRTFLLPNLGPFLLGFSRLRRAAFRVISQTRINYHQSPLSEGTAGDVEGGSRLPWVESVNNFEPLKSFDWQIHVYGTAAEQLRAFASKRKVPVHEFPWNEDADDAGLDKDALYLIRPDGYVALASNNQDSLVLEGFLDRFGIVAGD
jgi:2-polyprenyl-6-methoxyphenol hydroxylase-like FAD-dependent oxidoreductase